MSAINFSDNLVLGISLEHLAKSIDMDIFYCDNVEVHIKDFSNKRTSGYEWLDVFLREQGCLQGVSFVCINFVVATNALTT